MSLNFMKVYGTLIFVACLLTIIITKTAIGEIDQGQLSTQLNSDDIVHSCNVFDKNTLVAIKDSNAIPKNREIHSSRNSRRTIPNSAQARFWWAAEQFDPFDGELVQNWLTYPQQNQIDLVVNWHLWNLLDYLERYRFVNQFGTVAREYGYGLNIFNQKEECLATYKYNSVSTPPKWELYLEKLGQDSLQVKPLEIFKTNVDEAS